jgi:hypothetical protein
MIILSKPKQYMVVFMMQATDSGTTFTAANSATQPRENINIITQAPLGDGNGVNSSICSVTFTKK